MDNFNSDINWEQDISLNNTELLNQSLFETEQLKICSISQWVYDIPNAGANSSAIDAVIPLLS